MTEGEAVKEKVDKTLKEDWREDVQLSAKFQQYRQAFFENSHGI